MPGQGGIQLLPETRKSIEVKVPGENRWLYIGLGCFAVIIGVYAGLSIYVGGLEDEVQTRNNRIDQMEKKLESEKEKYDKVLVFSKQAAQIGGILRNHTFWSQAMTRIESKFQPQLQMKLFTASALKEDVFINAYAPNYAVIARQIAAFMNDDAVVDVSLGNVKVDNSGRVEFALTLKFDTSKFLKRSDDEF